MGCLLKWRSVVVDIRAGPDTRDQGDEALGGGPAGRDGHALKEQERRSQLPSLLQQSSQHHVRCFLSLFRISRLFHFGRTFCLHVPGKSEQPNAASLPKNGKC